MFDNPEAQALYKKLKLLVGIGVAAALESNTCALMWSKLARQAGAADAEIAEILMVTRPMKAATANDAATDAFAWLAENSASSQA